MEIENQEFDEERALYNSQGLIARNCRFDGPADGESAFKESRDIVAEHCYFNLRYPFWHNDDTTIVNCEMTDTCRAALWYSKNIIIQSSQLHGIKAVRECSNVFINDSDIISPEFGWSTKNLTIKNTSATSEYFLMNTNRVTIENLTLTGKYSFQYQSYTHSENVHSYFSVHFSHVQTYTHLSFNTAFAVWSGIPNL